MLWTLCLNVHSGLFIKQDKDDKDATWSRSGTRELSSSWMFKRFGRDGKWLCGIWNSRNNWVSANLGVWTCRHLICHSGKKIGIKLWWLQVLMGGFCRLSVTKPKLESSPSNAAWIVVKECVVFIVRCHTKNSGTASAQKPELLGGFQQSLLKGKVRRGVPGVELWAARAQFIGQWWGCYRG